ncbi:hypothetical protein B4U84_26085 [Westiellopsis prolifica IICB1]|nr:hypothetical protein B4U84_26085 [Westiellopsis prolifica IICB1]
MLSYKQIVGEQNLLHEVVDSMTLRSKIKILSAYPFDSSIGQFDWNDEVIYKPQLVMQKADALRGALLEHCSDVLIDTSGISFGYKKVVEIEIDLLPQVRKFYNMPNCLPQILWKNFQKINYLALLNKGILDRLR